MILAIFNIAKITQIISSKNIDIIEDEKHTFTADCITFSIFTHNLQLIDLIPVYH